MWGLRELTQRFIAARPDLSAHARELAQRQRRLSQAMAHVLERAQARLAQTSAHVSALDPQRQLERGYSIAHTADGAIVRDAAVLAEGDALWVTIARGAAVTEVRQVENKTR